MKHIAVLLVALMFVGCHKQISTTTPNPPQSLQANAQDAIATAKGFLDEAKKQHPECSLDQTALVCHTIAQAVAAKDTLINAVSVYCSGPEFDSGGTCTPHSDKETLVMSALTNLRQIMADAQGLK